MQAPNQSPVQDARMLDDSLYRNHGESKAFVRPGSGPASEAHFNKLFDLDSFEVGQAATPDLLQRLRKLGRKGGPMDALDPLVTITNPLDGNATLNPNNKNEMMTVGFTFLGQFLDHDITFDPARLDEPPTDGPNLRTPFFDLDSVYGRGPDLDRELYDRTNELERPTAARFLIDPEAARDLPRTSQMRAIISDPRNDENVIISQLQLAFLKFHNRVTDLVEKKMFKDHEAAVKTTPAGTPPPKPPKPGDVFAEAQKQVRWHYQWIIVRQFLTATLDKQVYDAVWADHMAGTTTLFPASTSTAPKIPREFQVAAYRFGHSQIRPGYKVNVGFGAPIFDAVLDPKDGDPNDLRGGRRAPRRFVEWDTFFDFGTMEVNQDTGAVQEKVKRNKRIDPFISSPMFDLPVGPGLVDAGDDVRTLAGRNLERHMMHDLPSGQAIAAELGYPSLQTSDFPADVQALGFHVHTPLWYYVLLEALVQPDRPAAQGGQRLGLVGSRIVAEVFLGLLMSDPRSYLTVEPNWVPWLPRRVGAVGDFTMTDLLTFARVA